MVDDQEPEEFSFLALFVGIGFFALTGYGAHLFLSANSFVK